jgi:hypothetical protein
LHWRCSRKVCHLNYYGAILMWSNNNLLCRYSPGVRHLGYLFAGHAGVQSSALPNHTLVVSLQGQKFWLTKPNDHEKTQSLSISFLSSTGTLLVQSGCRSQKNIYFLLFPCQFQFIYSSYLAREEHLELVNEAPRDEPFSLLQYTPL